MSVHSRGAAKETIQAIKRNQTHRAVLHWYFGRSPPSTLRSMQAVASGECAG